MPPTKKKTPSKRKPRSLVVARLENISKTVFRKHYDLITEIIGNSPGIYALYDESELYYVGKSADLRKRVRHHLRDRHYASWTHFSFYLVRRVEHIHEIESLLIRISNPKGNRVKPKGKAGQAMLKQLQAMVKQRQEKEFQEMFGLKSKAAKSKKSAASKRPESLKGLVKGYKPLYRTYKGKEYKAILTASGIIKVGKKKFKSPTGAAMAIVDRKTVNGWTFWYIKNSEGEWVKLADYTG